MTTCDHGIPMDQNCALCMHEGKGARPAISDSAELQKMLTHTMEMHIAATEGWEKANNDLDEAKLRVAQLEKAMGRLRQQLAESERQREELLDRIKELAKEWNERAGSAGGAGGCGPACLAYPI